MDVRDESKKRLSSVWMRTRAIAGVSQEHMAGEMGVSRKTIQNWEKGLSSPDLEQGFRWFEILGINPMQYVYEYVFPELENLSADDESDRLRTALIAILSTLSDESIRQLLFILYGKHGSSPRAILQLVTAHLQTPMRDRVTQAGVIVKNYEIARNRGKLTCPDNIQPDFEYLSRALDAGEQAVYHDVGAYMVRKEEHEE